MADGYERLPEWFWHPTHGLYGHEEPARPGDRTLYVRVDDAAGSPPPTPAPAPTRELVDRALDGVISSAHPRIRRNVVDAVMALLSAEPAPPLWTGKTEVSIGDDLVNAAGDSVIHLALGVPPGTAVEVRAR